MLQLTKGMANQVCVFADAYLKETVRAVPQWLSYLFHPLNHYVRNKKFIKLVV